MRLRIWLKTVTKSMMPLGAGNARKNCGLHWSQTPGTALGTAARISTTAHRWVQLKTMNAKLTLSHRLGQSFQGKATSHGLNRQWTPFKTDWCVSTTK